MTSLRSRISRLAPLTLALPLVAVPVFAQDALDEIDDALRDARSERASLRDAAVERAADLSAVEASLDELAAALVVLEEGIAGQEADIEATEQAIAAAELEVEERLAEVEAANADIAAMQAEIQDLAVDAYIRFNDDIGLLEADNLSSGVRRSALLGAVSGDQADLLDQLHARQGDREAAAAEAEEAEAELEALKVSLEQGLDDLEDARAAQVALQTELEERASGYEAEIAALEAEQALLTDLIKDLQIEALLTSEPELTEQSASGFIYPIEGSIGSRFGPRLHPIFGTMRNHNGVDFGGATGQPIWAAKGGTVVFAGERGGFGNVVMIEHEGGVISLYAHQSEMLVSAGVQVGQGEIIGRVGSTGWSTGPHLHFEIRLGSEPLDPEQFLP